MEMWPWVFGCSALMGAAANGLALVLFCARPSLRTVANRFVINLLGGNLACAMTLGPLLVADHLVNLEIGSSITCGVSEGCAALFCSAGVFGVALVALDQYLAVTDPLRYHVRVSGAKSLLVIGAQWVLSGALGLAAAFAPRPAPSVWNFCSSSDSESAPSHALVYKTVFSWIFIGCVSLALVSICAMYSTISLAAHRSARPPGPPPPLKDEGAVLLDKSHLSPSLKDILADINRPYPSHPLCLKLSHHTGLSHDDLYKCVDEKKPPPQTGGMKTVRSSPNFSNVECEKDKSHARSFRVRISNASLFRYREESRAARVSALVVLVAVLAQLPTAVSLAYPQIGVAPYAALCVGGFVSPFLFAYRSRRLQKELARMFSCKKAAEQRRPSADSPPAKSILKKVSEWGRFSVSSQQRSSSSSVASSRTHSDAT